MSDSAAVLMALVEDEELRQVFSPQLMEVLEIVTVAEGLGQTGALRKYLEGFALSILPEVVHEIKIKEQ